MPAPNRRRLSGPALRTFLAIADRWSLLLYDSDRHRGGTNVCAYRPSKVLDVLQAEHFEITVAVAERRIDARRLP